MVWSQVLKYKQNHDLKNKVIFHQITQFDGNMNPLASEVYFIWDADGKRTNIESVEIVQSERKVHDDSYFRMVW